MQLLKLKFKQRDRRGEVYEFKAGGKTWLWITLRRGKRRGGHSHSFEQPHLLLSGKLEILTEKKGSVPNKFILLPGSVYRAKKGEFHLFKALQNSIFIEPAYTEKAKLHQKWRPLVEKDLTKNN